MREHLERIRRFEALRQHEMAKLEAERRMFAGKLMKYGLCPCVALGRYNSCCEGLKHVQDGFFYIN